MPVDAKILTQDNYLAEKFPIENHVRQILFRSLNSPGDLVFLFNKHLTKR